MTDGDKSMLLAALSQHDVYPKALANFMFREIIEDAHTKYHISQEDMKVMCREAVNRAALFIAIQTDPQLYKAFAVYAIAGTEWDESEMTEELYDRMTKVYEMLEDLSK